ncbi:MAG: multiheme c-type cytochrome [Deltaproteobacteria bacterium]|nr:multiheme c-type cytochrome [Deltaproteobacteria bacterium]
MKSLLFLGSFLTLLFLSVPDSWAANSCINCHQTISPVSPKAHAFGDWKNSRHAKNGITCEACHGGDSSKKTMPEAHRKIANSRHPKSPLYFSQIPETCGACHAAELAAFKKSYHYSELKRTGKGPNCLTCHGSMATKIIAPAEMDRACSLCHDQPKAAGETLVTLNLAGTLVEEWGRSTVPGQDAPYRQASKTLKEIRIRWHSFHMKEVLEQSRKLIETARQEIKNLKLKTGR